MGKPTILTSPNIEPLKTTKAYKTWRTIQYPKLGIERNKVKIIYQSRFNLFILFSLKNIFCDKFFNFKITILKYDLTYTIYFLA